MADQSLKLEGKLYLIRHGEYDSGGVERLNESGRKSIISLAEKIKPELNGVNSYGISFFSTGYCRTLESVIELVQAFGNDVSHVTTSGLLYDAESCKQFFDENLAKLSKDQIVFAVCHLPFIEHFPAWFFKKIHPKEGKFEGEYGYVKGTGIYIDFKTGEHRELSIRAYKQKPVVN